jgi:site-specific recombinase XerD
MTATIIPIGEEAAGWERALYAFLAEKERRSGSRRTVEGYSHTLQHFFGTIGKPPDKITSQEVFTWAYGKGLSDKEPAAITIGSRLPCLSSFYRFLIRMEIVSSNPCDQIERPKASPSPPRGISADGIRQLLSVIPDTPTRLRDKAIILTLVLTGRRRAKVLNMKVGNLIRTDGLFYTYRGKGGKRGKRELPLPAFEAIRVALAAFGKDLDTMKPEESLWPSPGRNGSGITSGTFYGNLQRYLRKAGLPPAGVHIFRHSAAKLRRDVAESVEDVSCFLDHSSLAVTTVYLRRLEGQEDRNWQKVAIALGV